MPHIDDPCDANDEWEKRARRAMAWFTLRPYQREAVEALIRNKPKRPGGNSYMGDDVTYRFLSGTGGYTNTSEENSRRYAEIFVGIDHADGPDRSVDLVRFTKPELKAIKARYNRHTGKGDDHDD